MLFFNCRNTAELCSDFRESFFICLLRKCLVHVGPLFMFTGSCLHQVVFRIMDLSALQKLEPHLCVFLFIQRGLRKGSRNLLISVFLRSACPVIIFVAGLAFAGKCIGKILLCFCSLNVFHIFILLLCCSGRTVPCILLYQYSADAVSVRL